MSTRRIRTILYGDQAIEATELDLLHTPTLQRLYDLHQLGLTDRVFIDASHSRLHHVIGVLEQVDNILAALIRNLEREATARQLWYWTASNKPARYEPGALANYIRTKRRATRLMGLVHDLTHAPFGHTLEDEIDLHPKKHDHPDRQAEAFYMLLLQFIGWLCIDDGQFDYGSLSSVVESPQAQFQSVMTLPAGMVRPPESEDFICYVADLAIPFLLENKPARGMQRGATAAELMTLFHDLGFAMRGLLHLDTLHSESPLQPVAGTPYAFERLLTAVLEKAHATPNPDGVFQLHRDGFFLDVIGNTICADLLDYAKRDSLFAGLRLDYDVDRIVENFSIVSCRPTNLDGEPEPMLRTAIRIFSHKLRIDVPGELMNLLQVRFYVYQRVLFHPTKCIAGAMLGSAIQLIGWRQELPFYFRHVGDAVFLQNILECAHMVRSAIAPFGDPQEDHAVADVLDGIRADLSGSPRVGMAAVVHDLLNSRRDEHVAPVMQDIDAAIRLLRRLGARRYHRGIFRLVPNTSHSPEEVATMFVRPGQRARAEREIEKRSGLPRGSVTIHCPSSDGPRKIAEILIMSFKQDGTADKVAELHDVANISAEVFGEHQKAIRALESMYESMWRLIVSVAPPYTSEYQRLNLTIGRVLYCMLHRLDYDDTYGHRPEDVLNRVDNERTVHNDPMMDDELRLAENEYSLADPATVRLIFPDGHHEKRSVNFLAVADEATSRLADLSPTIRTYVEDRSSDPGKRSDVVELVQRAIPEVKRDVPDLFPESRPSEAFRMAARNTAPSPSHVEGGDVEAGAPLFSDEEVFRMKMGRLGEGKTGADRLKVFLEWATPDWLPLGGSDKMVRFLEFLRATMSEHYSRTKVFTVKQLNTWFREFETGHQLGTRL